MERKHLYISGIDSTFGTVWGKCSLLGHFSGLGLCISIQKGKICGVLFIVEWSGVEWSGVEWSGVEWSRVEKRIVCSDLNAVS